MINPQDVLQLQELYQTIADLPTAVKNAYPSKKRQRQFLNVWNSAYQHAKDAGKSSEEAETSAFKQAHSVVQKSTSKKKKEAQAVRQFVRGFVLDALMKSSSSPQQDNHENQEESMLEKPAQTQIAKAAQAQEQITAYYLLASDGQKVDLDTFADGKHPFLIAQEAADQAGETLYLVEVHRVDPREVKSNA